MLRRRLLVGLLFAAGAVAGCGSSSSHDDLGLPPPFPHVLSRPTLLVAIGGIRVRLAVPAGWGVANLTTGSDSRPSLVRVAGACYMSIAIDGATRQTTSVAQLRSGYGQPAAGRSATVVGNDLVLLLNPNAGATVFPGTLGTAFVQQGGHSYLSLDFGAGVWPHGDGTCTASRVAALTPQLRATIIGALVTARLELPPDRESTTPPATNAVRTGSAESTTTASLPAPPAVVLTPAVVPTTPAAPVKVRHSQPRRRAPATRRHPSHVRRGPTHPARRPRRSGAAPSCKPSPSRPCKAPAVKA